MIVLGYAAVVLGAGYLLGTILDWYTCDGPPKGDKFARFGAAFHEVRHAVQLARAGLFVAVSAAWLAGVRP